MKIFVEEILFYSIYNNIIFIYCNNKTNVLQLRDSGDILFFGTIVSVRNDILSLCDIHNIITVTLPTLEHPIVVTYKPYNIKILAGNAQR